MLSRDEEALRRSHGAELPDSAFHWLSPDEKTEQPFSRDAASARDLASQYDLCISGDALTHLHRVGADTTYVPLAQVPSLLHAEMQLIICTCPLTGHIDRAGGQVESAISMLLERI